MENEAKTIMDVIDQCKAKNRLCKDIMANLEQRHLHIQEFVNPSSSKKNSSNCENILAQQQKKSTEVGTFDVGNQQ